MVGRAICTLLRDLTSEEDNLLDTCEVHMLERLLLLCMQDVNLSINVKYFLI